MEDCSQYASQHKEKEKTAVKWGLGNLNNSRAKNRIDF
jgi:hypothetical protein